MFNKMKKVSLIGEVVKGIGYETAYKALSADPANIAESLMKAKDTVGDKINNVKNKFKNDEKDTEETVDEAKEVENTTEESIDEIIKGMDDTISEMEKMAQEQKEMNEQLEKDISKVQDLTNKADDLSSRIKKATEKFTGDIDTVVTQMMDEQGVIKDDEDQERLEKLKQINKEIEEEEIDEIDQLLNFVQQIEEENLMDDSIDHLLEKNKDVIYGEDVIDQLNDYDDNYEYDQAEFVEEDIKNSVIENICNRHEIASNVIRESIDNIYTETEDDEYVNKDLERISDELDEMIKDGENIDGQVAEGSVNIQALDFQAISNSMKQSE